MAVLGPRSTVMAADGRVDSGTRQPLARLALRKCIHLWFPQFSKHRIVSRMAWLRSRNAGSQVALHLLKLYIEFYCT